MRDDSGFPYTNCWRVSFFQQKLISLKFSPTLMKMYYLKLLLSFITFFLFSHLYLVCCGLSPWKKGFASFSLLPFTKKLGRFGYDVTMTQYNVILILFFFTFVANAPELYWDNFLLLTMNRRGVIRI